MSATPERLDRPMAHRTPHAALDAADRIAEHDQRTAARTAPDTQRAMPDAQSTPARPVRDTQRAMNDEQSTPALRDAQDALAQGQAPGGEPPALVAMIAAAIVRRGRTAVGDALADDVHARVLDAGRARGTA